MENLGARFRTAGGAGTRGATAKPKGCTTSVTTSLELTRMVGSLLASDRTLLRQARYFFVAEFPGRRETRAASKPNGSGPRHER